MIIRRICPVSSSSSVKYEEKMTLAIAPFGCLLYYPNSLFPLLARQAMVRQMPRNNRNVWEKWNLRSCAWRRRRKKSILGIRCWTAPSERSRPPQRRQIIVPTVALSALTLSLRELLPLHVAIIASISGAFSAGFKSARNVPCVREHHLNSLLEILWLTGR